MPDFDTYWRELKIELGMVPDDWERIPRDQVVIVRGKSWRVDWLRFSSVDDMLIWGWIAQPSDHPSNGVGFLWLPGYSYGTPSPDETNLVEGVVTFGINVHGNPPDAAYTNPAGKDDYAIKGIESSTTYIFRKISCHCLRALGILAEQEGVDPERLCVGGMSQGGALALIVAAQDKRAKLCFADMPFFCDIPQALKLSRSPAYAGLRKFLVQNPDKADAAMETVELFDPINHAPLITVPTWMSAGGRDPASKAPTIEAVYEKLGTKIKEYRFFESAGHVFLPEMNAKQREWISQYLLDRSKT
jgi:cephalosporin-C deacetylase